MHPMRYRKDGGGADLLFSENRKNRSMPCSAALRDLVTTILENPSFPASSTSPSNAKNGCEGWIRMTARAGWGTFGRLGAPSPRDPPEPAHTVTAVAPGQHR